MISRVILLALGVSLLTGCGRSDHPTIHRSVSSAKDQTAAAPGKGPSQAKDATDRASAKKAETRAKRDSGTHLEPSDVARSSAPDMTPSIAADADHPEATTPPQAKVPDATPAPKSGETAPANTSAAAAPATVAAPAAGNASNAAPPASPNTSGTPPAQPAGQPAADATKREVKFGGVSLLAPATWTREPAGPKFILAEFSLPRSQGDSSDAQLTVTLAVNDPKGLDRLREQIKDEEQSKESVVEHRTIGGCEVIVVDSSGNEDDSSDSSPVKAKGSRYRSLNAMVFLGGSVYFVNCTGPEKTVTERVGEFRAFLETLKAVK